MEDGLFERIINECSKYKLERIIPYLNNEPFIDKKYVDRIRIIRERMPDGFIEIATNAELLTKEIGESMFDLEVDELRLSVHGLYRDTYTILMKGLNYDKVYSNIESLLNLRETKKSRTKVAVVVLRAKMISSDENEAIKEFWKERNVDVYEFEVHDRSGSVPNLYEQFTGQALKSELHGCSFKRQLERMHILYNGDVVCCCQDWKREYILGNVKEQSLYEIWNGTEYTRFREYLSGSRLSPEDFICKRCSIAL
jgi:radical SAM protein with 4Fe4S-binding SPASM domain